MKLQKNQKILYTRCGSKGEDCPIYGNKCGSDIERCPIYRAFHIIGKKWTLQILQEIFVNNGKRRFNEIRRSLYWITPKVISKRLHEMIKEGLIEIKVSEGKIPRIEYVLTKKGKELDEVIKKARDWGMKWEV